MLYRVRATLGTFVTSPSNNDVAYTKALADDPPLSTLAYTNIQAVHLVEVRAAVNALRELGGSAPVFTGNDLSESFVRTLFISAAHFTTLTSNMNAARATIGLPSKSFSIPPVPGGLVLRSQITELRSGVK